ncbi:MAG: histidinol-phosphatase [Aestuariivita sp.]|nr:histidinol-phosphatase [Aestuariivita sp.]
MLNELHRRNLDKTLQKELLHISHKLADAARLAILPIFRSDRLRILNKDASGFDPVTEADRACEKAMRDILQNMRPEDGVLGEEFEPLKSRSGLTWVLDPLDGTRGFISGTPTWGVLIALSDTDGPILGIIDQPYIQERFVGGFGVASFIGPHGSKQLATRVNVSLAEATLFTTFPEVGDKNDFLGFRSVADKVNLVRYGLDCYAYALLAAGHIDLIVEAKLNSYDIQAPIAVIEAAGGLVTNWRGGPAHNGGQAVATSTPELLEMVLPLLNPYAD